MQVLHKFFYLENLKSWHISDRPNCPYKNAIFSDL